MIDNNPQNYNLTEFEDANKILNMRFYIPYYIAKKASNLLTSSGYILHSSNTEIDIFLDKLQQSQNLLQYFAENEYQLSQFGRLVVFAEKIEDNWVLQQSNGTFPINVNFRGNLPYYTQFFVTNRNTLQEDMLECVTIDGTGIQKSEAFSTGGAGIAGFFNQGSYKPKQAMKMKDVAWSYLINSHIPNLYLTEIGFSPRDTYIIHPSLFDDIQLAYEALMEDVVISQNKIITTGDLKVNNTNVRSRRIIENQILQTENVGILGGTEVRAEFLKAIPNSGVLYEGLMNLFDYCLKLCGYSPEHAGSKYSTSTEQHYSREQDIQTTELKRKMRDFGYRNLIGNILKAEGLWDGKGPYPFIFQFNNMILHDKMRQTERLILEIDNGLITKSAAIQMMMNLSKPADALNIMKQAQQEMEDYPMLFPQSKDESSEEGNQKSAVENPKTGTKDKQEKKDTVVKK